MANIDKTSVSDEVSRLKIDFDKLCAEGKITAESKVLMSSLFMILELVLAIFLERKTKKDNNNSSKPSSQTEKDESSLSQHGSRRKGRVENGAVAGNTRVKERTRISQALNCEVCGENSHDEPCVGHERRTRIDIVFEKVIEHVDAEIKACPSCHSTNKGKFPSDMHGP